MTEAQIVAADVLLQMASVSQEYTISAMIGHGNTDHDRDDLRFAAYMLEKAGLFELYNNGVGGNAFRITEVGVQFRRNGRKFGEYLKEIAEKEAAQNAKEERENQIKLLQYEDLKRKVNEMNQEQIDFWKAQRQKNLQTTLIAIISAIFSLIALLKTFGYF
jgi:hypothetical protein